MALTIRRTLFLVAVASAMPLLTACPKKETPQVDAAPPPPPPVPEASADLVPMEDDAGAEDAEAGPKKATGPAVPTNVLRLKQCCAALRKQAKSLGTSPEVGVILGVAAQCDALAASAGPSGNAPELGALKAAMAGKTLPPVCAGF
jgi:hypothetical protein